MIYFGYFHRNIEKHNFRVSHYNGRCVHVKVQIVKRFGFDKNIRTFNIWWKIMPLIYKKVDFCNIRKSNSAKKIHAHGSTAINMRLKTS